MKNNLAQWIWCFGLYERKMFEDITMRRYERDVRIVPYDCFFGTYNPLTIFRKTIELKKENRIKVCANGVLDVTDNGVHIYNLRDEISLSAGIHELLFLVYTSNGEFPALYVEGEELVSNETWEASVNGAEFYPVGCKGFYDINIKPHIKKSSTAKVSLLNVAEFNGKLVYDAGKEMMGIVCFSDLKGRGKITVFYGETKEEAADADNCETLDRFDVTEADTEIRSPFAKGFRYFTVEKEGGVSVGKIQVNEEVRSKTGEEAIFKTDDKLLQNIWDISVRTFDLTSRELYIDGIKRDRWCWGGDAYLSLLFSFYGIFDKEVAENTLTALFSTMLNGVVLHINRINAYSFYVIIAVFEYMRKTGNYAFVKRIFNNVKRLMDFCISRCDENGMMCKKDGDWMFVDWSKGVTDKGYLCYIQVLMCVALRCFSEICEQVGCEGERYKYLSNRLYDIIQTEFWDEERGCFINSIVDGKKDRTVLKQANAIAVFYGIATPEQEQKILNNVLLNKKVPDITSPFMRFFELSVLAELGETDHVFDEIKSYWGGMLKLGATSFWETFDENDVGNQHYAMYGRKYGKSLCHAWGAAPIFILGKHFIGVTDSDKGCEVVVTNRLPIDKFEYKFKSGDGVISIKKDGSVYSVLSENKSVTLRFKGFCGNVNVNVNGENLIVKELEEKKFRQGERLEITLPSEGEIKDVVGG